MERVLVLLAALAVLSLGFGLLEWRFPAVRGQRRSRRAGNFMVHANVGWSFGPLRHVVTSPAYHRWHHSAEPEARNKNFAGLFPFWDRLFGTLYMPKDRRPTRFGVAGDAPPAGFLPQLLYPLRSPRKQPAATLETA